MIDAEERPGFYMRIDAEDLLNSILASFDRISYIKAEDIPNIDLYMDQVTTFIDKKLKNTARYQTEDKLLTKTMINNYAKNNLLPPPVKKKYSKEHVMLLIFIYYFKGLLSISDIQALFEPLTDRFFECGQDFDLEAIYKEAFDMEEEEIELLKQDVVRKYEKAQKQFDDAPEESQQFLKLFSFICLLSFDVYTKRLLIEKLIDEIKDYQGKDDKKAKKNRNKDS